MAYVLAKALSVNNIKNIDWDIFWLSGEDGVVYSGRLQENHLKCPDLSNKAHCLNLFLCTIELV
jgi:hypothetical protein